MRDFKCVACRIRTRRAGDSADVTPRACPSCGAPLEPVRALTEIVGFRSVTSDLTVRHEAAYVQRVSDAMEAGQCHPR
jgi:hypothetical protein